MSDIQNVTIIGSGPAGYTAAIYAARSGLSPLLLTGLEPGGQLMITNDVENFPGFEKPVEGPWLMDQMKKQAQSVGTIIDYDRVTNLVLKKYPYEAHTEKGRIIKTYSIIISTGAKAKWLGIPGEEKFTGFGVSACATCDGFFYKNRNVAVIGGGNTALEEAIFLSNICKKVTIIHRRDKFRAEKILQDRLFKKKNIEVIWNSNVIAIDGEDSPKILKKIKVLREKKESYIELDGLFVAIGHSPATEIFRDLLPMDSEGYIFTENNSTKTKVKGVFAAGDVTDKIYRQAVTAAGMGCMSAIEAENYLNEINVI
ncbi:MAG: thioredoxin-disulfide reductase [Rickettsiales bacterium]|nr:thioredoxin-disulfide reductase [Rickettsiales bacterium]OUV53180.1 MAG: thioredoxin-disulfide reductase [Rickettsiales bacterium TMED127]|tara:strand:+ start:40856 stop:41794 length:939 start_codon:yes stop_codon:yes gene_type:complete